MKIIEALKRDKRGFTLVELIVVLVILVVLAAILVPTLMGYINQAGAQKDYAAAQSLREAAQAEIDEHYAEVPAENLLCRWGIGDSKTLQYRRDCPGRP